MKQATRVAAVGDVRGKRAPKGRHLAAGELMALLEVCVREGSPSGVRDAAVIALAWATGLRRSELTGLRREDFLQTGAEEGAPALAGDLTVRGKGDRVRIVYLYHGAATYLLDWLKLRGPGEGSLFLAVNKGGGIWVGHGVSDEALAQMLEKRRVQAGVAALDVARLPADVRREPVGQRKRSRHRAKADGAREPDDDGGVRAARRGGQASGESELARAIRMQCIRSALSWKKALKN